MISAAVSSSALSVTLKTGQRLFSLNNPINELIGFWQTRKVKRIDLFEKSMKVIPTLVDMEISGYKLNTFEH